MSEQSIKAILGEAIRYWEPRRIAYNLVLAAITAGWFVYFWPYPASSITIDTLLVLFMLAVLANACYCAAYVVDVVVQLSDLRAVWRLYRWTLFALGLLFASAASYFFARAVFIH